MKKAKPLVLIVCTVLLAAATVFGTVAYLTDSSEIVNTFTVGRVALKLDEAVVDATGTPTGGRTETGNEYHLLPGATYTKDPTVSVVKGSEEAYVRMLVKINCASELDAIFAPSGAALEEIFNGYDASCWLYQGAERDAVENTMTYEFRYKEKVKPDYDSDLVLDALFDSITVPQDITGEQLATVSELRIIVEAHAIQAIGFADHDEAWEAFSK